jgi:uncharacterized RDD family membrane protein YckC
MTTPTNIEYDTPSLLRRLAAMVYDTLLVMAISILYSALATGINVAINGAPATGERITWGAWGVVVFAGWILTTGFFFCYFWHKSGQTLGMKTWRIKIVNDNNLVCPTYQQCIIRCLCAPLSLCLLGAGYWFIYINKEQQTLHDKISNTRTLLLMKN